MSVNASYKFALSIAETLATDVPAAKAPIVTHDQFSPNQGSLRADTPVPASLQASFLATLVAGALTLDLTALVGTNGIAVNGTGLRVQLLKFINPAGSNHAVSLQQGASNGYQFAGANWSITRLNGQEIMLFGNNLDQVIGAGHKTIDLAGTGTESFQCQIVMG